MTGLKKRQEIKYINILLFIALETILFLVSIRKIYMAGNILAWDEFGYWGNAATINGMDWSSAVSRYCGYYSYGYSILCALLIKIFKTTVLAHKAAIIVNGILNCLSMYFVTQIGDMAFGRQYRIQSIIVSFVALFYTNTIMQSGCAWTECLLIFLCIFIAYLFLKLQENFSYHVFLEIIIANIYIFYVHPRTVPIFIASVVALTIYLIANHRVDKKIILLIILSMIIFAGGWFLRIKIKNLLYIEIEDEQLANTIAMAGPWVISKFKSIYGIADMIKTFFLRFFYFGITTFLFFFVYLFHAVKQIKENIQMKKFECFNFWVVLSMLGIFGIMTLHLSGSGTVQNILYGRYQDIIVAVPFFMGVMIILSSEMKSKTIFVYMLCSLVIFLVGIRVIESIPIYSNYFVANCNATLYKYYDIETKKYELMAPILISEATFLVVSFLSRYSADYKKIVSFFLGIIVVFYCKENIEVSNLAGANTWNNAYNVEQLEGTYEKIGQLIGEDEIVYFYHDSSYGLSQQLGMWLQFYLYEKSVVVLDSEEDISNISNGFLIIPCKKTELDYAPVLNIESVPDYQEKYLAMYHIG